MAFVFLIYSTQGDATARYARMALPWALIGPPLCGFRLPWATPRGTLTAGRRHGSLRSRGFALGFDRAATLWLLFALGFDRAVPADWGEAPAIARTTCKTGRLCRLW